MGKDLPLQSDERKELLNGLDARCVGHAGFFETVIQQAFVILHALFLHVADGAQRAKLSRRQYLACEP